MAMRVNDTRFSDLAEVLLEKGFDGLGSAVTLFMNEAMKIERESRAGYANGFKSKQLKTRLGILD